MSTKLTQPRAAFVRLAAIFLGAAVAASVLFTFCYRYDNKYMSPGVQPADGVLSLSAESLQAYPKTFLIRDWKIYRGVLLTPEAFAVSPPAPDEFTFIGQYGGFEGKNRGASPHGSASYRLRMVLPPEVRSYTLELPEIYSSYRLYINGQLMKQMGEPSPAGYRAHTGNSTVTVQAAGTLELLLAVSDYGYFYSGMVYPPAFGEPDAVAAYLNLRFGLRMAALVAALCIGLIALGIRVLSKPIRNNPSDHDLILLYALLCFCFVGYIGYPVVKTLLPGGLQWYFFENFCYCAIYLLVGLIQHHLSGWGGKATMAFVMLGLFVCCCSVLVPLLLPNNLMLMLAYSALLKLYTYAFALFLTASTGYSLLCAQPRSTLMLVGIVVFDCGLIFDRVYPSFEPILFGWFNEISSAVLVVFIGALMVSHVAQQYRARLLLEEQVSHASHMLELQSTYYPVLLEKEQEARAARHDLRHHFLMLRELVSQKDLPALAGYLDEYDLAYLQPGDASYCKHYVVDMLLRLYEQRAKRQGIRFTASADVPEDLPVGNVDLCVIISNLMENALEASGHVLQEQRWVHIGISYQLSRLTVVVDNRFDGQLSIKNGHMLSRKREHTPGVGLISVKAVAGRYQGRMRFYPDEENQVFHSEVLLTARRPGQPETGE